MTLGRTVSLMTMAAGLMAVAPVSPPPLTLAPESRLWVEGTSTVRRWTCKAPVVEAAIDGAAEAPKAVLAGDKAIRTVALTVPIARMNCQDNDTMNEHMRKALKATEFPAIAFTLASYELATTDGVTRATLTGTLTMGGVTQPLSFPVDLADGGNGRLKVTGQTVLKMREFNLSPPSLMLGTMRVGNEVTVKFDLLLAS